MLLNFTLEETGALYGLIAHADSDIILKTDAAGGIVHASPAFATLGRALPAAPHGPHLAELARPDHALVVRQALEAVLSGRLDQEWLEVAIRMPGDLAKRFSLHMCPLRDAGGIIYGALAMMRCVEQARALEEELFAASMTDALTGLTNRTAFLSMLEHLLEEGDEGYLALFTIDHFRAINLNHGQAMGDKVLCAFADFLRGMAPVEAIVSRIGSDIFAVLYPRTPRAEAEASARDMIACLAQVSRTSNGDSLRITASAGFAELRESIDPILRRAELALFKARAAGPSGFQSDLAQPRPPILRSA